MEKKRLTAIKTKIKQITTGKYVVQEGFNPNYIITNNGTRLSRVRILATVVDKFLSETNKFASITLDDGTDTIRAKAFNAVSIFESIGIGDIIDAVGRIREYQGEIYILPEIVTKAEEPNMEILRELEIKKQENELEEKRKIVLEHQNTVSDLNELKRLMKEMHNIEPSEVEAILSASPEQTDSKKEKEKILSLIAEFDSGEGCEYTMLIENSGSEEDVVESAVSELLEEGSCFEPKPGKIKKI